MPAGVSRRVLFFASGAVALTVVALALALILATGGDGSPAGSETSDATFLTASRSSDIAILDLETGRIRLATQRHGRYLAVSSPTWSPDGRRIAFAEQVCPHCPFRIAVAGAAGTVVPAGDSGDDLNEPSWSPNGNRLAVTRSEHLERSLVLVALPAGRLHPLEIEEEASEEEASEEVESPNHPAFSPDGRTIAFDAETERERTSIFLLDLMSNALHPVKSEADHYAYPAFSPNGGRLAFSRTDAAFTWDLCVSLLSGRKQTCLTRGPANDTEPSWAPDGHLIVFASDRDDPKLGLRSLYLMNLRRSGIRRLTTSFDDGAPAFSPDGSEIAFVRRSIVQVKP